MKNINTKNNYAFALIIGALLAAGPAMAEKPSWAGEGKGGKDDRTERNDQKGERRDDGRKSQHRGDGASSGKRKHFEDRHQVIVRDYFATDFKGGRCPPGLAKKNNGCMPPGQAKKWQLGQPLPRGVIYYDLPHPLLVQIGPAPSGYRFVRVASDILLMALGTGMIIDAIQDLGR